MQYLPGEATNALDHDDIKFEDDDHNNDKS